jgi:hypothetical protein
VKFLDLATQRRTFQHFCPGLCGNFFRSSFKKLCVRIYFETIPGNNYYFLPSSSFLLSFFSFIFLPLLSLHSSLPSLFPYLFHPPSLFPSHTTSPASSLPPLPSPLPSHTLSLTPRRDRRPTGTLRSMNLGNKIPCILFPEKLNPEFRKRTHLA